MSVVQYRVRWNIIIFIVLAVLSSVLFAMILQKSTNADESWSWDDGTPLVVSNRLMSRGEGWCLYAHEVERQIVLSDGRESRRSCISEGTSIRVATDETQHLAVSFPGDTKYYEIMGMSGCLAHPACMYLASKDMIIRREMDSISADGWEIAQKINIFKRVSHQLSPNTDWRGQTLSYTLENYTQPDLTLKDRTGKALPVMNMQVSQNEDWLVLEVVGAGLVRMNLNDMTMKKISNLRTSYEDGVYVPNAPAVTLSISNDGRTVVVGGRNVDLNIYTINDNCGESVEWGESHEEVRDKTDGMCPYANLTSYADNIAQGKGEYYPRSISHDSSEFTYTSLLNGTSRQVTLRASGYTPKSRLDYLALGDSYSSGEGDTQKRQDTKDKYYRDNTDVEENIELGIPREKCHISTRSYPYILAQGMRLHLSGNKLWDTVACSGAMLGDIGSKDSVVYKGQNNRLSLHNVASMKAQALNEFIPGRQKQIEFVREYKPKVITLTAGGNDVGFGDKIRTCVIRPTTCDIATDDGKGRLADQIKGLYGDLKSLYTDLYVASGETAKIYVLGYPQFINADKNASCGRNVGLISAEEREMMSAGVTYMNNVIEMAARATGAKYIDIEDSLVGGRLCDEGAKSMTGIATMGDSELQESFHPNSSGHHRMAMAVWDRVDGESLLDYDNCPDAVSVMCPDSSAVEGSIVVPEFFGDVSGTQERRTVSKSFTRDDHIRGDTVNLKTESFLFKANSDVEVVLHSNPVHLGVYRVDSAGAFDASVVIPNTAEVGYHTLIMEGLSYSGEPVRYEQVVLVKGDDPNDIDADSIPDDVDGCLFVPQSNQDVDQDGIDDACDPEIGAPPAFDEQGSGEDDGQDDSQSDDSVSSGIGSIVDKVKSFIAEAVAKVVQFVTSIFSKFRLWA